MGEMLQQGARFPSMTLKLCGVSIITIPSEVVTKPWLQPLIWVSTKTLLVSCCTLYLHIFLLNYRAESREA